RARDRDLLGSLAHHPLDSRGLGLVVQLRRRPVGVDVVDVLRTDVRVLERLRHGACGTVSILFGHHDVKGIVGHGEADDLAEDLGPAALGVLERLQDQHARALAGDEAMFGITRGTKKGEMRSGPRSPRSAKASISSEISLKPPIPVPSSQPIRVRSSLASSRPDWSIAILAAATPTWLKRAMRLASLKSM